MRRATGIVPLVLAAAAASAAGDYLTERWGSDETCRHRGTVALKDGVLTFDLSALPKGAKVHRAILRPGIARRGYRGAILLCPVREKGADGSPVAGEPLRLRPPWYRSFDATAAVQSWAADPARNLGLAVKSAPGLNAAEVVLEVSYDGRAAKPVPEVAKLEALHQAGQTFLTFAEIEDPVGKDAPSFEEFHNAVMGARKRRSIAYRVYRSDRPITAETLGQAELVLEVPEILTSWNHKAIRVTEHPDQGTPTMRSSLRPGYNCARNHVMTRYRIAEGAAALPRATGLAVITAATAGRRYYAVTAAVDGGEAVRSVRSVGPVQEKPSKFPAMVYLRSMGKLDKRSIRVDVYNCWVGPPYHNVPTEQEVCIVRWPELPARVNQAALPPERQTSPPPPPPEGRLPLWVFTGTYGSTAAGMGPGFIAARRHVTGAFTIGLAEGGIWQGFHECMGTLKSYDQGVVHNYPQRRVLAAAAWGVSRKDFFIDPQRVYFWSQLGSWALRYGDVFAVVMSNGYGNLAVGKQAQNFAPHFGPGPLGSRNWLGIPQWEYADLPKWIRENPTVELPYWICWPAYGAYPSHTIGDFGFLPWPETFHAMHATKRAFAATWNTNGPGVMRKLFPLVTRIRRDQSLPAFGNCNLDANPGDGDHADAEKSGGINVYQRWEPETIVDEPGRWEIALSLHEDCPAEQCVTDVTPRRYRKLRAEPGWKFRWTVTAGQGGRVVQTGTATADKWGLVTMQKVRIPKAGCRLKLARAE